MRDDVLLRKLEKVTEKVASFAIREGYPIQTDSKTTIVGSLKIIKNKNKLYDVVAHSGNILYSDISAYDVAVIVAQRHNLNEKGIIKKILVLNDRFIKYNNDMIHYLRCLKTATLKKDYERVPILEDKFQVAEGIAKNIRDRIVNFKLTK